MSQRLELEVARQFDGVGTVNLSLALARDGRLLCAGESTTIDIFSSTSGKRVGTLTGHGQNVNAIAVAPDGRTALSGDGGGAIRQWDLSSNTCAIELTGHTGRVAAISFDAQGGVAVSASWDGSAIVWDVRSGKRRSRFREHTDKVAAVDVSSDGKQVFSTSFDGTIRSWDAATGGEAGMVDLSGHTGKLGSLAATRDRETVIAGGVSGDLWIWKPSDGDVTRIHDAHSGGVSDLAFFPGDRWFVSTGYDKALLIWDLETTTVIGQAGMEGGTSIPGLAISMPVAVSPDGRMLVCGRSGRIAVIRVPDGSGRTARAWWRKLFRR
jgi:WD40 repeat protein